MTAAHQVYYHPSGQSFCRTRFAEQLRQLTPAGRPVLLLCIGSDRSTGDSLGPLIGYKLQKQAPEGLFVLGTLDRPVHAVNLPEALDSLPGLCQDPFIIAIDASLGRENHIGYITLSNSSLQPGLGIGKSLPDVGHISITGIVGSLKGEGMSQLQTASLGLVMNLADCIASGILKAFWGQPHFTALWSDKPQWPQKWWKRVPVPGFPSERQACRK